MMYVSLSKTFLSVCMCVFIRYKANAHACMRAWLGSWCMSVRECVRYLMGTTTSVGIQPCCLVFSDTAKKYVLPFNHWNIPRRSPSSTSRYCEPSLDHDWQATHLHREPVITTRPVGLQRAPTHTHTHTHQANNPPPSHPGKTVTEIRIFQVAVNTQQRGWSQIGQRYSVSTWQVN